MGSCPGCPEGGGKGWRGGGEGCTLYFLTCLSRERVEDPCIYWTNLGPWSLLDDFSGPWTPLVLFLPLVVVLVAAIGKDQSTNRHPRAIQLQFFWEDGQFIFQPKFGSSLSLKSDALYHCIPSPLWLLCSQEEKINHPTSLTPPPPPIGAPSAINLLPGTPTPPLWGAHSIQSSNMPCTHHHNCALPGSHPPPPSLCKQLQPHLFHPLPSKPA
jgi:hypothetical protein